MAGGEETRERILATAARMFVQRGYAATSVRDIAGAIGVSNPSLYHHFASKGDLLAQLLAEPVARVQAAVDEASSLDGEARTRRILHGLLEALEVHSGVAVAALRDAGSTPAGEQGLAAATRPLVHDLLAEGAAEDNRSLRIRMVMGAVERAVVDLMLEAEDPDAFVVSLRAQRDAIVELALRLLR